MNPFTWLKVKLLGPEDSKGYCRGSRMAARQTRRVNLPGHGRVTEGLCLVCLRWTGLTGRTDRLHPHKRNPQWLQKGD